MRYYSDMTRKFYETPEACEKAELQLKEERERKEAEALQKTNARKEAAKKVETAYNELVSARKNYQKLLADFCKEYGPFHMSLTKDNALDLFDSFWENWF